MPQTRSPRLGQGFTLIEILVVIAIIGVAGAVVVPSMLSTGNMGVQAAARMVIADIIFAQNDAIADQGERRVVFDVANNRYWLSDDDSFDMTTIPAPTTAMNVAWKGENIAGNYIFDFDTDSRFQGVAIQNAGFPAGGGGVPGTPTLEFDSLGGPTSGGSVDVARGNLVYRITVADFTGRITIAQISP